jgi:methylthioribose-1-phosphate isomerase
MNIDGIPTRTIAALPDRSGVSIIDQTRLPFRYERLTLRTLEDAAEAISVMRVRGAPLIGATAAYGVALALKDGVDLDRACAVLAATRPTAVNLAWALGRMKSALAHLAGEARLEGAWVEAAAICDEDVELNRSLGRHGAGLIRAIAERKSGPVNVLTHCNAGWLAAVDWGTAIAPIYAAHDAGVPIHVWVDETRPRNQGGCRRPGARR